jgi:hypothetical protein
MANKRLKHISEIVFRNAIPPFEGALQHRCVLVLSTMSKPVGDIGSGVAKTADVAVERCGASAQKWCRRLPFMTVMEAVWNDHGADWRKMAVCTMDLSPATSEP